MPVASNRFFTMHKVQVINPNSSKPVTEDIRRSINNSMGSHKGQYDFVELTNAPPLICTDQDVRQVIPMIKEVAFERKLATKTKEIQKQGMKIYKEQKKNAKGVQKESVPKPPNIMMISDAIMIFLKSMPSLRPFLFVPEKTLWKLCKLWEGYGMFEFVMKFNQAFENQNKKSF